MSDCLYHQITFSRVGLVEEGQDAHLIGDKPADVADLVCPTCGAKLFVYYRLVPAQGGDHAAD